MLDVAPTDDLAARQQKPIRRHDARIGLDQVRKPPDGTTVAYGVALAQSHPTCSGKRQQLR
jgi:hypothetical protein